MFFFGRFFALVTTFFQLLCFFVSVCLQVDFRFSLVVQPKTRQRGWTFSMKPVPRHRTGFEFIQSIMDPLTFEKNVLVEYFFFTLRLFWICPK